VAREQMCHEHFGESGLLAKHTDHRIDLDTDNARLHHRDGRGHVQWLAGKARLADELAGVQDRDHSLLALVGYDSELHLSLKEVKDSIGRIALSKDILIRPISG